MANVGGVIFGSDQPAVADAADNTTYCMGTIFTSDVAGKITKAHWRVPNSSPGGYNALVLPIKTQLWKRPTTTVVGTGTYGTLTLGEWNHTTVDWDIEANIEYVCSVVLDRYVATSHYFDADKVNGHITVPALGGRFSDIGTSITPSIPNTQFGGGGYFIDFDFVPEGSGASTSVSLWNGSAEVPVVMSVWNGSSEIPASFDSVT